MADKKRKRKRKDEMLITSLDAPFQYQEAFHFLRTNIKFLAQEKECKKIAVTSSIPGEGKSTVAVNLALSLSASNSTVILIDADLRKPVIHTILDLEGGSAGGLVDVLHDWSKINACVRTKVDDKNLYVLPSGMIYPNPTELLGSKRMGALIEKFGENFDYVIVDTPPVSIVTDAAMLSQHVDGMLMVVRQKFVTFEQATKARHNLENVNANIIGTVFNDFSMKNLDSDSGYYYNYYNQQNQGGRKR